MQRQELAEGAAWRGVSDVSRVLPAKCSVALGSRWYKKPSDPCGALHKDECLCRHPGSVPTLSSVLS